jgi:hypothetical protein
MSELPRLDDTTYSILVQVLIAFGQGAGTAIVSKDVVLALTADYAEAARAAADGWDEQAAVVRNWAQVLGALAARTALSKDRAVIELADYQHAKDAAAKHSTHALGRCRWTDVAGGIPVK